MRFINKNILRFARFVITRMPRGRSVAIRTTLRLFGNKFDGAITAKDGRKFYIGTISLVKQQLFFVNEYEDYETSLIKKIVKPGDFVLDVGACFGWYSTLMSRLVGSSGMVYAFELAPNIARECRNNVRLNHMESNVVVEDIALGEKEGVVDYIYSENLGLGNLNSQGLAGGGILQHGIGRIIPLDLYIERHGISKINFIKCDVDGAEALFLKGARETIARFKPVIIIEASGAHGRPLCSELFQELNRVGYVFFSLHHKKRLRTINEKDFGGKFKENVLCLTSERLDLLKIL